MEVGGLVSPPGARLQGCDQEPPVRWERRLAMSASWVTCLSSSNRISS